MRLFLALDLGQETRAALAAVQRELRAACRGWRWVRPEAFHLTVRFLGEVDPAAEAAGAEAWRSAADGGGPVRFRLEGLGTFPPGGRPRVMWVGVHDESSAGRLPGLAERVERVARELGFAPEGRPFRPHLTLARAARGGRPDPPPREAGAGPFAVRADALTMFSSELRRDGARYTALWQVPLAASDRPG